MNKLNLIGLSIMLLLASCNDSNSSLSKSLPYILISPNLLNDTLKTGKEYEVNIRISDPSVLEYLEDKNLSIEPIITANGDTLRVDNGEASYKIKPIHKGKNLEIDYSISFPNQKQGGVITVFYTEQYLTQ